MLFSHLTRLCWIPCVCVFALAFGLGERLAANSDVRTWILANGDTFDAELVRYEDTTKAVTLRFRDVTEKTFDADRFGAMDRAWLVEWAETEDDLNALVKKLGGKLDHLVTTGKYPTDLFVYTPSPEKTKSAPPALILFHPGGKAARYVKSHMEAAERSGMMLVACGVFRNTGDKEELEAEMLTRFREVLPQILNRVRLDPARVFMGGTSGGAWRAYHYSAQVSHRWAGIYANGGWLGGGRYYELPYPSGMRVVMVNGNLDTPANQWVDEDGELLKKAGCTVGVIAFEGGHQVPPTASQFMAFEWLLGRHTDPRSTP